LELLKEKEVSLHTFKVRSDVSKLQDLLHREYLEIGYSGVTHTFFSVLEKLPRKTCQNHKIWSQSFECLQLAPEVFLLVYLSANLHPSGRLSRYAKRSSVWVNVQGVWQLKFHQATPVEKFERKNT
jgi:hypothetical protein